MASASVHLCVRVLVCGWSVCPAGCSTAANPSSVCLICLSARDEKWSARRFEDEAAIRLLQQRQQQPRTLAAHQHAAKRTVTTLDNTRLIRVIAAHSVSRGAEARTTGAGKSGDESGTGPLARTDHCELLSRWLRAHSLTGGITCA